MMSRKRHRRNEYRLSSGILARIILPVTLTVILFGMSIFLLMIPLIEEKLLDGKREMIRELTESSWSILAALAQKEAAGQLTRQEAQPAAVENIRGLPYAPELKD